MNSREYTAALACECPECGTLATYQCRYRILAGGRAIVRPQWAVRKCGCGHLTRENVAEHLHPAARAANRARKERQ